MTEHYTSEFMRMADRLLEKHEAEPSALRECGLSAEQVRRAMRQYAIAEPPKRTFTKSRHFLSPELYEFLSRNNLGRKFVNNANRFWARTGKPQTFTTVGRAFHFPDSPEGKEFWDAVETRFKEFLGALVPASV